MLVEEKFLKIKRIQENNETITVGTIKNLSKIYSIDILIKGLAIAHKKLLESHLALAKNEDKNCR